MFESGLFIGRHGRERTFLVTPRSTPTFKLPSDLDGITTASYDPDKLGRNVRLNAVVEPACSMIRDAINQHLHAPRALSILAAFNSREIGNVPLKIYLHIRNLTANAVLIDSASLTPFVDKTSPSPGISGTLNISEKMELLPNGDCRLTFRKRYPPPTANPPDWHLLPCVLIPAKSEIDTYVGLDPVYTDDQAKQAVNRREVGTVHLTCYWLGGAVLRLERFTEAV